MKKKLLSLFLAMIFLGFLLYCGSEESYIPLYGDWDDRDILPFEVTSLEGEGGTIVGNLSVPDTYGGGRDKIFVFVREFPEIYSGLNDNNNYILENVPVGERQIIVITSLLEPKGDTDQDNSNQDNDNQNNTNRENDNLNNTDGDNTDVDNSNHNNDDDWALDTTYDVYSNIFHRVTINANKEVYIGTIYLRISGQVNGRIIVPSLKDPKDVNVSIPGTVIKTNTNYAGQYTLDGVPAGDHTIMAYKKGFLPSVVSVSLLEGEILEDINIRMSNVENEYGIVTLASGVDKVFTRKVPVYIIAPDGFTRMMLSNRSDFNDALWMSFKPYVEVTFPKHGEHTLYTVFTDDKGKITAPVSDSIVVDLKSTGNYIVRFATCGKYCSDTTTTLITQADNAVKVKCYEEDSVEEDPVSYQERRTITFSEGDGRKVIYCEFIDIKGVESDPVTAYTILDTTSPTTFTVDTVEKRVDPGTNTIKITVTEESTDESFKGYQVKGGQYPMWMDAEGLSFTFDISTEDIMYSLGIRAVDQAGNTSEEIIIPIFHGSSTIYPHNVHGCGQKSKSVTCQFKKAFSPYIMKDADTTAIAFYQPVTVEAGTTIVVDAGMGLRFFENSSWAIEGTKEEPVKITSLDPEDSDKNWNIIYISGIDGTGETSIKYTVFEGGDRVTFSGNKTLIEDSIFDVRVDFEPDTVEAEDADVTYSTFEDIYCTQSFAYSIVASYLNISGTTTIGGGCALELSYSNLNGLYQNLAVTASSSKDLEVINNYWGYNKDDAKESGYQFNFKIEHAGKGTITWTPYSSTAHDAAGVR